MKIHKPIALGLVTKPFDQQGKTYFVISLLVGFRLGESLELLSEAEIWETAGEELPEGVIFDEGMWKRRGELLVTGSAHAVGEPRTGLGVRVQLGEIDKRLYVVGDRTWGATGASEPEPFSKMPIAWQNAFGGPEHEPNPFGKGVAPPDGTHALPNVEHPDKLIKSPDDRPKPMSFEGFPPGLRARTKKLGTYDASWLKNGFPGYAEDIDWTAFNAAPEDQWLADDAFFVGDEAFRIENMHPEHAVLEGTLPGVRARLHLQRGDALEAQPLRLDTVRLFPSAACGVLIFRAVTETADELGSDIQHLVAAIERADEPKPLSHYRDVLERRLDPDRGHLEALKEKDLLPAGVPSALDLDAPQYDAGDLERENLFAQNMRNKALLELERLEEKLRELGVDPQEHPIDKSWPEPTSKGPPLDELGPWIDEKKAAADAALADAEKAREKAEADTRKLCEERGLDYDALVRDAEQGGAGPKLVCAERELDKLKSQLQLSRNAGVPLPDVEAKLSDPNLVEKLKAAEAAYHAAYRRGAHLMPAAKRLDGDEAETLRAWVVNAKAAGESLAGCDLTGARLSKLDLRGVDLSRAFLENARLDGCDLTAANLEQAVLARADLTGAKLAGANLKRANLGKAELVATDFDGVDAQGAIFAEAHCITTRFHKTRLAKADFTGAKLKAVDFEGIEAEDTVFYEVDLTRLSLVGANLEGATFVTCSLAGVDLARAVLMKTNFVTCNLDGANFAKASGAGLKLAAECTARGADFKGGAFEGACFAGSDLAESDFSGADLAGANFTGCDLQSAKLYRARARGAMLMQANLTGADLTAADLLEGLLMRANIAGASFKGANLFRANFIKVRGDDATSFEKANMDFICYAGDGS